jgi:hypothetical protein
MVVAGALAEPTDIIHKTSLVMALMALAERLWYLITANYLFLEILKL